MKPRSNTVSHTKSYSEPHTTKKSLTLREKGSKETSLKLPRTTDMNKKRTNIKKLNTDITLMPSDLVLAFERYFFGNQSLFEPLSKDHIDILTAKETVKIKPKAKKKSLDNNSTKFNFIFDQRDIDEWNSLDPAKKERRVLEIMNNREDIKKELTKFALEVFPISRKITDYNLSDYPNPLIYTKDLFMDVELGDPATSYQNQIKMLHVEDKKIEVNYYTDWFSEDEHRNYISLDKELGPIVISIQKQRKDKHGRINANSRILIRTKDSDEWLFLPSKLHSSEILNALKKERPKLSRVKFEKVKKYDKIKSELIQLEKVLSFKPSIKVGVLYVKKGQTNENEMFSNISGNEYFEEFLDFIGERIELNEWKGYSGGLDTKLNLTGTHSVYRSFDEYEIMFHVSTLLPYNPNDEQQVERKRHIGNDVVCIIFLEDECSFDPCCLTTNFTYVFIVITIAKEKIKETGITHYKMAVATRKGTRPFGPRLHYPAIFEKNDTFLRYLLTKIINSERAAFEAPAFKKKMNKTKESFLIEMINNLEL